MKNWICESRCRAVKTIIVQAATKKEAQRKLDDGEGEGVEVDYYSIGRAKVIREDLPRLGIKEDKS